MPAAATVALAVGTYIAAQLRSPDAGAASADVLGALEREPAIKLPPLTLPTADQTILLFGHSWAEGVAAERRTCEFASLTGRRSGSKLEFYRASGTGCVNASTQGVGAFSKRVATPSADPTASLVVIRGGVNDVSDPSGISQAVTDTVTNGRKVYPPARIVVFGVMPLQADTIGLHCVSSSIGCVATRAGAHLVSPLNDGRLDAGMA